LKKTVKTVSFMMIATLLSKIAGLLRDVIIAGKYGTEGMEAVAYSYASSLPVQLFDFTLGAAVLATFIPIFNGYLENGEDKRATEFSNNFINIVVLISTVISVLCMIFSKYIGLFIAPDLDSNTQQLLQQLIIIVMPTTIFTALAYSFVGILQSFGEFNIPAIISLVSNVVIIMYLLFFDNVYGLCIAMLVGWSLQFIVQIPSLKKKKFKYKFSINFKDPGIREAVILAIPILISSWVQPISVFINKRYASAINGGGPALDYANRFYIIVVGVFVFAITNYIFPALSKKIGSGDVDGFGEILSSSIKTMLLIIAPIMIGMMLVSNDIISLVYQRGQFNEYSVNLTSSALKYYSIGMIFYGVTEILNKCFYSLKNAKVPMIASIFGIGASVALSSVTMKVFHLGVLGLAFSSAMATVIVSMVLMVFMQKKVRFLNKDLLIHFVKVTISVAVMGLVVMIIKNYVENLNVIIRLILMVAGGGVVYLAMLWILKVKELREVFKWLRFLRVARFLAILEKQENKYLKNGPKAK